MRNVLAVIVSFVVAIGLVSVCSALAEQWWVRTGVAYRGDLNVEVNGTSYVQAFGIHATDEYRKDPPGIGSWDAADDREYEDGYVYEDVSTAFDDLTWFWGYEDASQYDAGSQTLSFRSGGGIAYKHDTLLDIPFQEDDDLNAGVFTLQVGFSIPTPQLLQQRRIRFEAVVGIQGVGETDSKMQGSTFRERVTRETYDIVDQYDVDYDLTASAAHPPPYDGTFMGPGPLIPNSPSERTRVVTSSTSWEAANHVSMRVRSGMLGVSAGPRAVFDVSDKISIHATPTIAANFVDLDIERDETFQQMFSNGSVDTIASWNDDVSEQEWLLSFGIQLGADIRLSEDWFAGVHAGYDWADEAEVTVGPNSISFDPTSFTVGGQVGRRL